MNNNMIVNLNEDLNREYLHLNFYLAAATNVTGLHREEYAEFFSKNAAEEMTHVLEFRKLIIGLGGVPQIYSQNYNYSFEPVEYWLKMAYDLETEVVQKYAERIIQAEKMQENGGSDMIDGKYIEIFLEEQLMHSRQDADNIKQMLSSHVY
jgi:bacterioferritin (cytochrome b1)